MSLPTFSEGTDSHGEATEEERESRGPPPAAPVDPEDAQQVGRELHGGGDHEGEVELEVEVGDVPHSGVVDTTDHHPEEDAEETEQPHPWCFEKIQIGVLGSGTTSVNVI